MPRKPNPKPDNPGQFKRFIEMAREVEADESPDAVDRAFDKVMGHPQKIAIPLRSRRNASPRKPRLERPPK
jgi:hypothetical protein